MNKKAQSQIITMILVVLIVLAAILVVWQVIKGVVSEKSSEVNIGIEGLSIELKAVKADAETAEIVVSRRAGGGAGVVKEVLFFVDGEKIEKDKIVCPDNDCSLEPLETKIYGVIGNIFDGGQIIKVVPVMVDDKPGNLYDEVEATGENLCAGLEVHIEEKQKDPPEEICNEQGFFFYIIIDNGVEGLNNFKAISYMTAESIMDWDEDWFEEQGIDPQDVESNIPCSKVGEKYLCWVIFLEGEEIIRELKIYGVVDDGSEDGIKCRIPSIVEKVQCVPYIEY